MFSGWKKKDVKTAFLLEWKKYVPAILTYVSKSSKKDLRSLTNGLDDSVNGILSLNKTIINPSV